MTVQIPMGKDGVRGNENGLIQSYQDQQLGCTQSRITKDKTAVMNSWMVRQSLIDGQHQQNMIRRLHCNQLTRG